MEENLNTNIEQPIGRVLSLIGRNYLVALNQRLKQVDIERNYYALLIIDQFDGDLTQQELANLLSSDKVSVVRIIDYLSENGYVVRAKNLDDRRKYAITVTDKAKKEIENIKNAINKNNAFAFSGLNEDEIQSFMQMLDKINNNLKHSISNLCE